MMMEKKETKSPDLLKRGNLGLFRLLIAVNQAGPEGIATYKLLHQLGSTNHAKAFIARAVKEGLIEREVGQSEHGHFKPVFNRITDKGRQVLQSQLLLGGRRGDE
jgi:DNA-binding MarR family transcriptional regulator